MINLSILIVSWNTRALLADLLASLADADLSAQLIVIDNASTDASAEMVAERFPQVELICNAENVGFARANNQGIQQAVGRTVLLLNCDTQIPSGTLAGLVEFMDTHSDVGACSPRLLTREGAPQAHAFGDDPSLIYLLRRGLNRLIRQRPLHDWGVDHTVDVDWVSGACLLLRREALVQVGGLDGRIFMYFEDVDLCRRIRQQGWRVCYVPEIGITHLGGQSLIQNPQAPAAYQESLRYFYAKHYGPIPRFLLGIGLGLYNQLAKVRKKSV
jgi:N-acetylglucosaminyl-diphospho-decaprenol L-rhamnosyltransferase